MNKKKRTFLSMMVFLSVLCLSAIFNISYPIQSMERGMEDTESVGKAISELSMLATPDNNDNNIELNSLSYGINDFAARWNDPGPVSDAITKITGPEKNEGSTGANSRAVSPESLDAVTASSLLSGNMPAAEASMTGKTAGKAGDATLTGALYANIGISVANSFVNIRKAPSVDSEVLGKLHKDSAAVVLEHRGDWYYVESGSVRGYAKSTYIRTGIPGDELVEKYGQQSILVTVDGLNVRERADVNAGRLSVIYKNEIYPIVAYQGDWVKISLPEDQVTGYIRREYAEEIIDFKDAVSQEEEEELLNLQGEEWARAETQIRQQGGVNYSKEELKLLACLVHSEAGGQSYEGKLAVANVVLNRVKSSVYPDSIQAVIYQSGQFSVAQSGSLAKQLANYADYSSSSQQLSIKAARAALEGSNNIGSRMYFHSYKAALKKGYDDKSGSVKLGDHLFW